MTNPVIGQRTTGTPPPGTRNPAMPREAPGSRGVIGQRGSQPTAPGRGAGQPGVRAAAPKPVKAQENGVIRGSRPGQANGVPPRQVQRAREDEEEEERYGDGPLDDDLFRVDGGVPDVFTAKLPYQGEHRSGPALSGRDDRN